LPPARAPAAPATPFPPPAPLGRRIPYRYPPSLPKMKKINPKNVYFY